MKPVLPSTDLFHFQGESVTDSVESSVTFYNSVRRAKLVLVGDKPSAVPSLEMPLSSARIGSFPRTSQPTNPVPTGTSLR